MTECVRPCGDLRDWAAQPGGVTRPPFFYFNNGHTQHDSTESQKTHNTTTLMTSNEKSKTAYKKIQQCCKNKQHIIINQCSMAPIIRVAV